MIVKSRFASPTCRSPRARSRFSSSGRGQWRPMKNTSNDVQQFHQPPHPFFCLDDVLDDQVVSGSREGRKTMMKSIEERRPQQGPFELTASNAPVPSRAPLGI